MTSNEVRARIEEIGIIPAVRLYSAEDALFAAEAVCEGNIPIVEVTMTVPGAVEVIRLTGKKFSQQRAEWKSEVQSPKPKPEQSGKNSTPRRKAAKPQS